MIMEHYSPFSYRFFLFFIVILDVNSSKKVWKSEFDQELLSYLNNNRRMIDIIIDIIIDKIIPYLL